MDAFPVRESKARTCLSLKLEMSNWQSQTSPISWDENHPGPLACLLADWLACPLAPPPCNLVCFLPCLLACLLAWLDCLLACLPACLLCLQAKLIQLFGTKITWMACVLACLYLALPPCNLATLLAGLHACLLAWLAWPAPAWPGLAWPAWLAGLPAWLRGLPGLPGLLACLLACWLACLLACLLAP